MESRRERREADNGHVTAHQGSSLSPLASWRVEHWPRIRAFFRSGHWSAVAVYLALGMGSLLILSQVLKRVSPTHLSVGAFLVMLMYAVLVFFLVLASRLFVVNNDDQRPS